MNILVNTDIDLLDAISLNKRPVDRLKLAEVIPFSKNTPMFLKNKIIVVNRYLPEELPRIKRLARTNKIINRVPEFEKELGLKPYSDIDIIALSTDTITLSELQTTSDVRIIRVDDLLISSKLIKL